MLVLALDTCDRNGSVALLQDGQVVQAIAHAGGEEYSSWLLPTVQLLLGDAAAELVDVGLFAVATGPGSFTGVRLGLTTVKAWGEVFGTPIAGMSRLEVLASQEASGSDFVASVIDAQRGQVFAGLYQRAAAELLLTGEELVTTASDFLAYVGKEAEIGKVAWVGTEAQFLEKEPLWRVRAAGGERVLRVSPLLAPQIGKLGIEKLSKGQVQDALSLVANYVRRSYVEATAKLPAT